MVPASSRVRTSTPFGFPVTPCVSAKPAVSAPGWKLPRVASQAHPVTSREKNTFTPVASDTVGAGLLERTRTALPAPAGLLTTAQRTLDALAATLALGTWPKLDSLALAPVTALLASLAVVTAPFLIL